MIFVTKSGAHVEVPQEDIVGVDRFDFLCYVKIRLNPIRAARLQEEIIESGIGETVDAEKR